MTRFVEVAGAIGWRSMRAIIKRPSLFIPHMMMPVIFFAAFGGGLSSLGRAPGFEFPAGYTSFQFVFVLTQAAVFSGVFMGFGIARDYESGFADRFMLAAPDRRAIIAGYLLAALARASLAFAFVFIAGTIGGMRLLGSLTQLVLLFALALTIAAVGALWAAGVALRLRTLQSAPLMQIPVFLALFVAPVFVPLDLLTGWILGVARYNPVTAFLEAGRGLMAGQPDGTLLAYAISLGMIALLSAWSVTGLRRAERATS